MWLRDMLRFYARGQGLRRKTTTLLPGGREIFSGTEEERTKKPSSKDWLNMESSASLSYKVLHVKHNCIVQFISRYISDSQCFCRMLRVFSSFCFYIPTKQIQNDIW